MEHYVRQRDILSPDELNGLDVDVVGAGALGSASAMCLSKMGLGLFASLTVTDPDHCEAVNLNTQWYRRSDVLLERSKVEALAEHVEWLCEQRILGVRRRFTGDEPRRLGPVVVMVVDSLAERKAIWDRLKRRGDVRFLIDARMGAEVLEVVAVDLEHDDLTLYEQTLADPGDALEEPCTRRSIAYTVFGGAAFVGSLLRAYARREPFPRHVVFDFHNFMLRVETGVPQRR